VMESRDTKAEEQINRELGEDYAIRVQLIQQKKTPYERMSQHVPLFISVLALGLSIWSAAESRRHDRLSVQPSTRFWREGDARAKAVGLYIENSGLGPAIISDLRIYLDGNPITNLDDISNATATNYKDVTPSWTFLPFAFTIKSGDRIAIFATPPDNVESMSEFRYLTDKRLFLVAKPCSFYQQCTIFCSTKDDPQCEEEEKKISKRTRWNSPLPPLQPEGFPLDHSSSPAPAFLTSTYALAGRSNLHSAGFLSKRSP
jgi:hypothetical protein